MIFDLVLIAVICLAALSVVLILALLILTLPAWLRELSKPASERSFAPATGCWYWLTGPFRLIFVGVNKWIVQPALRLTLLILGGFFFLFLRFGFIIRLVEFLAERWETLSDRLWQANLNTGALLRATTLQNAQQTLSLVEQLLMRFASVQSLNRLMRYATNNTLGVRTAISTVLTAIARDEGRPLHERLSAVNLLSQQGYRTLLLNIAQDQRRKGQVVCQAAEALELRLDWHAAEQAWNHLLDHIDPEVRLRAANHLKFIPAHQGKAGACLRTLFNDERLPLKNRIEAAASLGRVNLLSKQEEETLQEWMERAPDPEAQLHAAYTLACLRQIPAAFTKLRRYSYEYQIADDLRALAIEYLGRLDRVNDLRPLSRLDWLDPGLRSRVGQILLENGHVADAIRCWLSLSQDVKTPLKIRLEALQRSRQIYREYKASIPPRDLLLEALATLGSEGEQALPMRLEAAQTLVELGEIDPARHILLVLAQARAAEPAIRRQASNALRRLSTHSI